MEDKNSELLFEYLRSILYDKKIQALPGVRAGILSFASRRQKRKKSIILQGTIDSRCHPDSEEKIIVLFFHLFRYDPCHLQTDDIFSL